MILAIDTATTYAGLALFDENGLQAEFTWRAPRRQTTQVAAQLARLLTTAGLAVEQLTGLAVALGPGSFTGVRVGLALAKGLALPHKLAIAGVPTLEITAYPQRQSPVDVWAVVEAGRGRIGVACFGRVDGAWQEKVAPFLTTVADLMELIDKPVWLTGELSPADVAQVRQGQPDLITVLPPALRLRRPGVLAELGAQRLARRAANVEHELIPIYLQSRS